MILEQDNNPIKATEIESLEDTLLSLIQGKKPLYKAKIASVETFAELDIARDAKGLIITMDSGDVYKLPIEEY